jgi:hypothetical protein
MSAAGPIRFRGTPLSLAALAAAPVEAPREHVVRLAQPERAVLAGGRELRAVAAVGDGVLRLHLPRSTPPGTYRASMEVEGEEREVEITVDPDVFLRIFPERLDFTAAPGAHVPQQLALLNLGNTPVEVRGAYAFGLFDEGGLDRAIGRMATASEGQRRIDAFADAVADEHGGLMRVKVESGEGTVQPGETRELNVNLHIPQNVRPGHSYFGTWPLYYVRYYVRVTGAAGEAQGTVS